MNVDFKIAQSIDIQNILGYTCIARKDVYRIKGFFSDDDDDIMKIAKQSSLCKRENEELPTDTLAQQ